MNDKIRLRFAPSPTGALHIGGVRTALYNYLFTQKTGGTLILRIEDTDQTRYVPGAEAYILESLRWLGMEFDEGPGIGGEFGPYRQSERKSLYGKYAQNLIDSGNAYYAFDTAEELTAMREAYEDRKETFRYDGITRQQLNNSLTLSAEEVKTKLENGDPYTIRLKVPRDEEVLINDIVRGEVVFKTNELDDKVMLKGDGMPTYHLANIVDDHLMKISHVVRGEEWLPSTAHHVLLYRFFGWEDTMPQFAHLPLILKPSPDSYITKENKVTLAERLVDEFFQKNEKINQNYRTDALAFLSQIFQDKKNVVAKLKISKKDDDNKRALKAFLKSNLSGKLSKRDGDRLGFPVFPLSWEGDTKEDSFKGFREYGFIPQAMLNFLAFLGWNPGTEQEIFSLPEMVDAFSMDRISKAGARFDFDKAKWFNQQYLIQTDNTELVQLLKPLAREKNYDVTDEYLTAVAGMMKERVNTLPEIIETGYYFFEPVKEYEEKMIDKKWNPDRKTALLDLKEQLENIPAYKAEKLEDHTKAYLEANGLGFGDVFPFYRIALSGTTKGPALFEMMEALGKAAVEKRLLTAFSAFDEVIAKKVNS